MPNICGGGWAPLFQQGAQGWGGGRRGGGAEGSEEDVTAEEQECNTLLFLDPASSPFSALSVRRIENDMLTLHHSTAVKNARALVKGQGYYVLYLLNIDPRDR